MLTPQRAVIVNTAPTASLQARITQNASQQTYDTVRLLADTDRVDDAYRAYAYFRWVDDWLDQAESDKAERIAFVDHQQSLISACYRGTRPRHLTGLSEEEQMIVDLIRADDEPDSGLKAYIEQMMAVMAFDAHRRGQLISGRELAAYSHSLAVGVTEALHYFIGHDDPPPHNPDRYRAVTAAHITHMLRDTYEDLAAGYFNIPREWIDSSGMDLYDAQNETYRAWVKSRVQLARDYFAAGKAYLAQVPNLRCRMAGYAYSARFEATLDVIEGDHYQLRTTYPEPDATLSGQC